jgi:hypothetical protein
MDALEPRSDSPAKQQPKREWPAQDGREGILEFLGHKLPPEKRRNAPYIADALLRAGARYDRYSANRNDWLNYSHRRNRLERIRKSAVELGVSLRDLDILSLDDLTNRVDPKQIEVLIGLLFFLSKGIVDLLNEVQTKGRPRDLAEERWILELADIYENCFCKPARIWGSGVHSGKRRGTFHELLNASRPPSFPRHGKLSLKQLNRTLRLRKKGGRYF